MGLEHVERNGHHFFGQLAPIDPNIAQLARSAHPDLYHEEPDGQVRLRIVDGMFEIGSIMRAPFGFAPELDISGLQELSISAAGSGL